MKAGVCDVFIPLPRKGYAGLFIEFKIKPNKLSDLQLEFINGVRISGYMAEVCFSFDEAIELTSKYLRG